MLQPNSASPRRSMLNASKRWKLALAISAAIAVISLAPVEARPWFSTRGKLHAAVHILAFFGVTLIGAGALHSTKNQLLFAAGIVALGALLELAQMAIYSNPLEFYDILSDAIGIVAGVIALKSLRLA